MSVAGRSLPRLILAIAAWLIAFPIAVVAALVLLVGNVGFTLLSLVVVLALWMGPALWMLLKWRRSRGNRAGAGAAYP
jgi:hypothetical protein